MRGTVSTGGIIRLQLNEKWTEHSLQYTGISTVEEGERYALYVQYKASTKTYSLRGQIVTTQLLADAETKVFKPSLQSDVKEYGIFIGDKADGTASGMRGRMEGLLFWQKHVSPCQLESDFNCGRLRELPVHEPYFGAGGGRFQDVGYIEAATEPTLSPKQFAIWRDSDNKIVYFLFNDPIQGQVKGELTWKTSKEI